MESHLFILLFISLVLKDILAKILLCGISGILLALFSSRTFMLSQLMFKSFIHFEFILVCSSLVSFICMYHSRSPNTIVEEAVFTPFCASAPFVKY